MFVVHFKIEVFREMSFLLISFLLLIAYAFSRKQTKQNKAVAFVLVLLMSMIIAFRDMKVPDTEGYVEWYLKDIGLLDFHNSPYEKGYTLFSRLFHIIFGNSFQLYFAVFPLLNFFLLSKSSTIICNEYAVSGKIDSSSTSVPFSLCLLFLTYFSFYGLYHNAIVLRAGVATTLIMLSLALFLRNGGKALFWPIIFFLLALSFHTSVIVCLPMYWLIRHDLSINGGMYIIVLVGIIIIYLLSPLFDMIMQPINQLFIVLSSSNYSELSKFDYYNGTNTFSNAGISFKFIFYYLFGWIFVASNIRNNTWNRLLNIYLMGLLIWAVFRSVLWVERITDFYSFFYIVLAMIYAVQKRKNSLAQLLILVASFIQIVFIYRIVYSQGA